jgi:hypothetical protein
MMRNKVWLPLGCVLGALLLLITSSTRVHAASTGGNGLRVSPVRTDVTISAGTAQTVPITVTNVTGATATLQTIINDFTASSDESGDPAILVAPNAYAPTHSLKRLTAPVPNFTLAPGVSKTVPIVITIPASAAAGGYYGAVRFAPATDKLGPNQNVGLSGSVGSLILVKVPGDIKEQMSIASFDARLDDQPNSFFSSSKGITATLRLQNEGNIQEEPFGKILLKNHSNKVLGTYEINNVQPQANVLPDSIRKFSIPLKNVGGFGEYKLEGNFGYGTGGQLLSASTTFYVIPLYIVFSFIGIVLLLVFLVFILPRLMRAYNQRVLRRAGRALGRSKRR